MSASLSTPESIASFSHGRGHFSDHGDEQSRRTERHDGAQIEVLGAVGRYLQPFAEERRRLTVITREGRGGQLAMVRRRSTG